MEEKEFVEIEFNYTDQFGNKTNVKKSVQIEIALDESEFEFLVQEFKKFLILSGFSQNLVDEISDNFEIK